MMYHNPAHRVVLSIKYIVLPLVFKLNFTVLPLREVSEYVIRG